MGNESSKSKNSPQKRDGAASSSSAAANAAQRFQKALPAAIKPGPSSAVIQRHMDQARKSKTLQLKATGLKQVPAIIEELAEELRTVDLSANKLRDLPPTIGQFAMLRQLHIQQNRLTHLPDELGCLKRLEVLNASGNQLETVPDSLIGCATLATVNLADNQLKSLPIVLTHLLRLELLELSGNGIQTLPDEISGLRATELNLQRNQLASLNASNLAKCQRLRTLRVDENCLQKDAFTKDLLEHSQLSLISFEGNLFQEKDFQTLPGYEHYEGRFTATKRRLF